MAWLLAQPNVNGLPRGELLVLGGDQVYPSASVEAYEDHFLGPFSAALYSREPKAGPARVGSAWKPRLVRRAHELPARVLPPTAAGSAAGAPARRPATSRCGCRTTGGSGRSTSSSTPTSTPSSSSTSRSVGEVARARGRPRGAGHRQAELGARRARPGRARVVALPLVLRGELRPASRQGRPARGHAHRRPASLQPLSTCRRQGAREDHGGRGRGLPVAHAHAAGEPASAVAPRKGVRALHVRVDVPAQGRVRAQADRGLQARRQQPRLRLHDGRGLRCSWPPRRSRPWPRDAAAWWPTLASRGSRTTSARRSVAAPSSSPCCSPAC